jgi:tetratricopeptide (TPR) repeat protein
MSATGQNSEGGKRLDSWKEIGAFFSRDERTVKRWEATRGLPVHRVPGGGRVYAYPEELQAWLENAAPAIGEIAMAAAASQETASEAVIAVQPVLAESTPDLPASSRRVSPIFVLLATVLLVGGIFLLARPPWKRSGAPTHATVHKANPKAEQLYLTGIYYWHKRTAESLNQAVDYFTQAIVEDPNYAPAYVGLADCYNLLREYSSMASSEAYPRALAAAQRAIALDESLSGAHSALAFAEFNWSWDLPEAEKEFRRAIELSPNSVPAHHWYATSLLSLGRLPEAVAEIDRAQSLDPQSTAILADKALILYCAGQKKEAMSLLKSLEASEPAFLSTHQYLSGIALFEGDDAAYLAEGRQVAELRHDPDQLSVVEAAERGQASGGRHGMLAAKLEAEMKLQRSGRAAAYSLAETSGLLGENQKAMEYLEESFTNHEPSILGARLSPAFAELHRDPRFQGLLAKIGLPALPQQ